MKWHTRHGDWFASRLPTRSERDVQQPRGFFGIVKKQFVKIPHAVQHQSGGVLGLYGQVLLHHGGVGADVSCHKIAF